jgi:hypothetical protein
MYDTYRYLDDDDYYYYYYYSCDYMHHQKGLEMKGRGDAAKMHSRMMNLGSTNSNNNNNNNKKERLK